MKEYSKEESIDIINRINKMQRIIFKYKRENGREPTDEEIASLLNETPERITEIKNILNDLKKQDEELEFNQNNKPHTKEDIEKAREIRKNNKSLQDIKKYIKHE